MCVAVSEILFVFPRGLRRSPYPGGGDHARGGNCTSKEGEKKKRKRGRDLSGIVFSVLGAFLPCFIRIAMLLWAEGRKKPSVRGKKKKPPSSLWWPRAPFMAGRRAEEGLYRKGEGGERGGRKGGERDWCVTHLYVLILNSLDKKGGKGKRGKKEEKEGGMGESNFLLFPHHFLLLPRSAVGREREGKAVKREEGRATALVRHLARASFRAYGEKKKEKLRRGEGGGTLLISLFNTLF